MNAPNPAWSIQCENDVWIAKQTVKKEKNPGQYQTSEDTSFNNFRIHFRNARKARKHFPFLCRNYQIWSNLNTSDNLLGGQENTFGAIPPDAPSWSENSNHVECYRCYPKITHLEERLNSHLISSQEMKKDGISMRKMNPPKTLVQSGMVLLVRIIVWVWRHYSLDIWKIHTIAQWVLF